MLGLHCSVSHQKTISSKNSFPTLSEPCQSGHSIAQAQREHPVMEFPSPSPATADCLLEPRPTPRRGHSCPSPRFLVWWSVCIGVLIRGMPPSRTCSPPQVSRTQPLGTLTLLAGSAVAPWEELSIKVESRCEDLTGGGIGRPSSRVLCPDQATGKTKLSETQFTCLSMHIYVHQGLSMSIFAERTDVWLNGLFPTVLLPSTSTCLGL